MLDFSRAQPSTDAGYTGVITRLEQSLGRASALAKEALETTEEEVFALRRRTRLRRRIKEMLRHLASVGAAADAQQVGLKDALAAPPPNLPNRLFVISASALHDRATEHLELLTTYALGENFMTDLATAIAEFESAGTEANIGRVTHVGARRDMIDATVECMELVNVLDGFNRARFATDTKLLGAWEAARNVFGPFTRSAPAVVDPAVVGEVPPTPAADEKAA